MNGARFKNVVMTCGFGILLLGVLWIIFWLGPAIPLFQEDPRWGHNFALPIIFMTVGLAYYFKKILCQFIAVFSSFLTVPIFLAIVSWSEGTLIAALLLIFMFIIYSIERGRERELVNPGPRLKSWLKIHFLNVAYLGLAHMPLIFFLVRWNNPDPFLAFLPIEHHASTSIFNLMLIVLTPLAIMERYVKKIGRYSVSKIGFVWAILMILIPLLSIAILGE